MQQIIQRLAIIKSCIILADDDLLASQNQLLKTLIRQEKYDYPQLTIINNALDNLDYPKALSTIEQFISSMTNISVYHDPEILALKLELARLEKLFNQLDSQHNEYVTELNYFNRLYNRYLGEKLSEILRLQMIIADKNAKTNCNREKQQTFEKAQQKYQEYQQSYQEELSKSKPNKLNNAEKKRLKKAFQQASKLCHPDMVTEKLKEKATQIFQSLNQAYQNKELTEVENILTKLQSEGVFTTASEQLNDKAILKEHIARLRKQITSIQKEIDQLKHDEVYKLIQTLNGDYDRYFNEQAILLEKELIRLQEQIRQQVV